MPTPADRAAGADDPAFGRGFGQLRGPLHWPSLTTRERDTALAVLREWVRHLTGRFGLDARVIPPCWDRHPPLVEVLSALRDHERGCYADSAAPTAGVEFIRALYDVKRILTDAVARTGCTAGEHREDRAWGIHAPAPIGTAGTQGS
ncbi:hypothetical protein [Intrasporangium sp.]|uniref:hypothetical protein n=1 Tax=Intrasporangium sp. TaxID=1925024 RepID=UPI003221AC9A